MIQVLVRHNVEDDDKWRPVYDGHEAFRKETGSLGAACSATPTILATWSSSANGLT